MYLNETKRIGTNILLLRDSFFFLCLANIVQHSKVKNMSHTGRDINLSSQDQKTEDRVLPVNSNASKEVLAIKINDKLYDYHEDVTLDVSKDVISDVSTEIITRDHPDALSMIRHSCAHVMAEAVQTLFPDTQVTIGPTIDNGFYYDFAREESFTLADLPQIEQKMHEIIATDHRFIREVWPRQQARDYFDAHHESYKAQIIDDLPEEEEISIYRQGNWLDLCRGPHIRSTGQIGPAFKLMKIAGAYWRGNSDNPMLQRIYGTAWRNQEELDTYLYQIEEAKRRDHRLVGKQIGLFHFQEEAAGSTFWHPKGWTLWRIVETYMRTRLDQEGYIEVKTPQLIERSLWEASGHWDKFRQHMFTSQTNESSIIPINESQTNESSINLIDKNQTSESSINLIDKNQTSESSINLIDKNQTSESLINHKTDKRKILALKPMNCPGHVQIYRQGVKSYRDLPLRMAEFGSCHRYEPSGSLHGLMRGRSFTQDDAHIFCTEAQVCDESVAFCRLLESIYRDFGFNNLMVKFSDRPLDRAGSDEVWDRAEEALKTAVQAAQLTYSLNSGDGAFYGPKLDFILRDVIGREWQCGTLQVDFVLPERLDASYSDHNSQKQRPVMLHRAILGSLERFIGILIEHYAGRFPFWLAPSQGVVATITHHANNYAQHVYERLRRAGLRVQLDTRNEKINLKIREHSMQKIPVIIIIGKREEEKQSIVLRWTTDEHQDTLTLDDAIHKLLHHAESPIGTLRV